jgi:integral membrane protein
VTPRTVATAFRVAAIAEACSWIGLLIGMFVKYVPETSEIGVKVFGPIHGAIFVGYVLVTLMLAHRWDRKTLILGLVASIPPFGTVVFERWANRTGRLDEVESQTAND